MAHQGNVYLGYNLVLNVTVSVTGNVGEKEESKAVTNNEMIDGLSVEEIIQNAIEFHAHQKCKKEASKENGKVYVVESDKKTSSMEKVLHKKDIENRIGNVIIIWKINSEIQPVSMKTKDTPADYYSKRIYYEKMRTENKQAIAKVLEYDPQAAIESFQVNVPVERIRDGDNLYEKDGDPFWFLGRRVRAAFTEYQEFIHVPPDDTNRNMTYCQMVFPKKPQEEQVETLFSKMKIWTKPTSEKPSKPRIYPVSADSALCSLGVNVSESEDYFLENPEKSVRKILDIRDAINIVCERLDGSMDFFPPIPWMLQPIFEGKAHWDESVQVRYKFPFGMWFRGANRMCYGLEPSLFRENTAEMRDIPCKRRGGGREKTMYEETSMVNHFMFNESHLRHDYHNPFEWLCLMQHYDMPSRVLDWSENMLTALFFAVDHYADPESSNCDGIIWALNTARLNEITRVNVSKRLLCFPDSVDVLLRSVMSLSHSRTDFIGHLKNLGKYHMVLDRFSVENKEDKFGLWLGEGGGNITATDLESSPGYQRLAYPVAVLPFRMNDRQTFQKAGFTLHGGKQNDSIINQGEPKKGDGFLPKPKGLIELSRLLAASKEPSPKKELKWIPPTARPFLEMFVIPSCAKRKIREQLKRIGIHSGTLYPDLDKQARYISQEWRLRKED